MFQHHTARNILRSTEYFHTVKFKKKKKSLTHLHIKTDISQRREGIITHGKGVKKPTSATDLGNNYRYEHVLEDICGF